MEVVPSLSCLPSFPVQDGFRFRSRSETGIILICDRFSVSFLSAQGRTGTYHVRQRNETGLRGFQESVSDGTNDGGGEGALPSFRSLITFWGPWSSPPSFCSFVASWGYMSFSPHFLPPVLSWGPRVFPGRLRDVPLGRGL